MGVLSFTIGDLLFAVSEISNISYTSEISDFFFAMEYLLLIMGFLIHFKMDLKYLAINPAIEYSIIEKGEPSTKLIYGKSYILKNKSSQKAYEIFKDYVSHMHEGFCITRNNPNQFKKEWGFQKTPVLWITNISTNKLSLPPENLEKMGYAVSEFLSGTTNKSIILIDGIEYLINNNSIKRVFNLLLMIKDEVSTKKSILIMPINTELLDKIDKELFEKEFELI